MFEHLGAKDQVAIVEWKLALIRMQRNQPGDHEAATNLLFKAHASAKRMGLALATELENQFAFLKGAVVPALFKTPILICPSTFSSLRKVRSRFAGTDFF